MTYALTFDNSWAVMSEDEMHDVNGGGLFRKFNNWLNDQVWYQIATFVSTMGFIFSGKRLELIVKSSKALWGAVRASVNAIKLVILKNPLVAATIAILTAGIIVTFLATR